MPPAGERRRLLDRLAWSYEPAPPSTARPARRDHSCTSQRSSSRATYTWRDAQPLPLLPPGDSAPPARRRHNGAGDCGVQSRATTVRAFLLAATRSRTVLPSGSHAAARSPERRSLLARLDRARSWRSDGNGERDQHFDGGAARGWEHRVLIIVPVVHGSGGVGPLSRSRVLRAGLWRDRVGLRPAGNI
jgi:hypothetical protein